MGGSSAVEPVWELWREGLRNGTDPKHPEYWGDIGDFDQRMVEMAVMGMALCLVPDKFFFAFPRHVQKNIHAWLSQINRFDMPTNNWRFFRVLINIGFQLNGVAWDPNRLQEDLELIESHYEGDGWYFDYPDQRDYYTFWAYHYYGLIYARAMEKRDPERSRVFRERARAVAPRFSLWFDRHGRALPYGRSLTYRFAESAFFAMLALDGQEAGTVEYGVMKRLLLGNMRAWCKRPIFTRDGVLTIGYGYPGLNMAEGYNAPGSPYWAMKVFAVLALPEDHPFWLAEEKPPAVGPELFVEPHARLLLSIAKDGSHVQAFAGGNHAEGHAHDDAKYEKFCYSTAFAFSVPKSSTLLHWGAYDSMLALSEAGKSWHVRYGVESFRLLEDRVCFTWKPFAGVTVDTALYPMGEWHIRVHRVVSDRPLLAAEGGYAIRREEGSVSLRTEDGPAYALALGPWGVSGLRALRGYREGVCLVPEPNTNLLYPRTVIPTLRAEIPEGESVLACAVIGAVEDTENKWLAAPGEEQLHAAMGR